ncbi:hypothetical protein [Faecalicoccus pleomorphus]|uniref:Uncharacterized protein n=1 Tax=Faecalicoccus pleomorphus TaxID=1323 RepID=A0A380LRJ3_9FIRM|nr:hypothetical protein [Faecalicoccus pleomorphus]MBM6764678.1 hypothetical protein [Faecalicoccus pleomorphus]MBM6807840.1 hypothetical protein [Faecalicoccus pleomorphus]SUO04486.1 Uncharacterised protein [Faecalicoccus pleomorphus]
MEQKMLVTQALDQRDLLVKKICDKIRKASFTETKKHNEEKVMERRVTQKEFEKEARSSYQQIIDLIHWYDKVDQAILRSNAETIIETSYGAMSIANALALRSRLNCSNAYDSDSNFEGNLMMKLEEELNEKIRVMEQKNKGLQNTAETMRLSILGKDTKTKDETPLKVVDVYVQENTTELIDPLNVRKKINELNERRETILNELDTKIKVSNATTFVEIN